MDWNSRLPLTIPQVLAVADTIPSRLFLWRNKMNEEIMNEIQPVRPVNAGRAAAISKAV